VLEDLGRRGVVALIVEGGATLLGSCFDERVVDEVWAFVAPLVIGGVEAPSPVAGRGETNLGEALRLRDVEHVRLGDDVLIRGVVGPPD
jgi:diaminohydroxyphosphoribosylaminopyrimidine deaminase/5-amino-6-(5-phosphoribosylamino)uracil reductase